MRRSTTGRGCKECKRLAAEETCVQTSCHSFSISIDGYGAGPNQDIENPLGVGGLRVFDWFFPARTWQRMHGNEDGETGVDDDVAARGFENIAAYILGRNMFGPVRGLDRQNARCIRCVYNSHELPFAACHAKSLVANSLAQH
jgi:hypothetical protein